MSATDQTLGALFIRLEAAKNGIDHYTDRLNGALQALNDEINKFAPGVTAEWVSQVAKVGFGKVQDGWQLYATYPGTDGSEITVPLLEATRQIRLYAYQNRDKVVQAIVQEVEMLAQKMGDEFPPDEVPTPTDDSIAEKVSAVETAKS